MSEANETPKPADVAGRTDVIVMRNGSSIRFVVSENKEAFVGTGRMLFCPECGCPTHKSTDALMCDCSA